MKRYFIVPAGLLLPACACAQNTTQQHGAAVHTEYHYKGTARERGLADSTGAGRKSTASWHYHSGPKREQVKIEGAPEPARVRKSEATDKSDSTGK